MSRWSIVLLLTATSAAQQEEAKKPPITPESKAGTKEDVQLPPEEDAAAIPEQYSFNPVKSMRDLEVGNLYFKKGDYKGAASRFDTATKWNDANAEAWLRLGETREKQQNPKAAREAFERYLRIVPDGKSAAEVKKRLEKLK